MDMLNDLFTLMPELILTVLALVVIVADGFLPGRDKWLLIPLTLFGLALAGVACVMVWGTNDLVFDGFYRVDDFSIFLKVLTLIIGVLVVLFGPAYLRQRALPLGEFCAMLIFALLGMMVLASSSDLITLFIGLELMVMPGYLLTGFAKTDRYSNEGGLKYFLLGSFASAILLFGIAWLYGLTGTTHLADIATALATSGGLSMGVLVALAFVMVGSTFKVAAVPFHFWTPDAYQGAPTPVTGYLSTGPKIGAFALLIRLFVEGLGTVRADWLGIMVVLAVLTMTVGNVIALAQPNVKRMLAYSSIAHTGYIMAGLAAFANTDDPRIAQQGIEAILFYSLGYLFMNLGAFGVVAMLQRDPRRFGGLNSFAGLASRAPGRAAAMAILLLSLTGIPPTVGFFAKWYVLLATVDAGLAWLGVIIVLNAALAAFYYLRVVVYMYMRPAEDDPAQIDASPLATAGLVLSVAGVVLLGIFPGMVLELLRVSAGSLF
ncbi:MAG: NADH-quinone oxidoreductase subunit N [Chloroflexota bacterium]